jgi:GTP-binding protein LepA
MELERERGITIKLNAVQLRYKADDGKTYLFHLIDTPGHVDFSYEVSRSLAACEGAILVVDAAQGVEAQTLANVYLALDNDLEILPVINKIDLPSADPDRVIKEIEDDIGLPAEDAPRISAKTGLNVKDVLEDIVKNVPAPTGSIDNPTQALIFDSYYDSYRGVIIIVCVKEGKIKVGDHIQFMATGATYEVTELGVNTPKEVKQDELVTGEVGWIAASIKTIKDVHVGDTITTVENQSADPLPGYKRMNPMVYCGLYPVDNARYGDLREALEKIVLSDSSLVFEPETSQALGFGFRCGFLGLLHMDVIEERLEREFNLDIIATAPSVIYHTYRTDGTMVAIDNPADMPDPTELHHIEEPYVKASIMTPEEFIGPIMELCQNKRGEYVNIEYLDDTRRNVIYSIPLSEIVYDFFDKLKSCTKGYASFDYELEGYRTSRLQKMDIMLNGEVVDALSTIVHKDFAYDRGKIICNKLKEIIPRQQFEIPVQAAFNGKIIARTNIKAVRKNVLAKCYGGDISRKKKLLEKQKEGKKRMKAVGSVEIPQEAFMAILSVDDD